MRKGIALKSGFHESGVGPWIGAVCLDVVEAEFLVEIYCLGHAIGEGVEAHEFVPEFAGALHGGGDEGASDLFAASIGADEGALEFADVVGAEAGVEGGASNDVVVELGKQESAAFSGGVVAGEGVEFVLEVLEGEVFAEPVDVFEKELADGGYIFRRGGFADSQQIVIPCTCRR